MATITWHEEGDTIVLKCGDDTVTIRQTDDPIVSYVELVAKAVIRGETFEDDPTAAEVAAVMYEILAIDKAGRVLSGPNLSSLQDIYNALGAIIQQELSRRPKTQADGEQGDGDANQGSSTTKARELVHGEEMEAFTKASDSKKPYGDVTYADPGYQKDGKKRYPLDTEQHIRAAWSYINQADNASAYTSEQLANIKSKIRAAMKRIGADVQKGGLQYVVTKAINEQQFTFGPLYAPNRKDAHGEWIEEDDLQKSLHEYVQECVDRGDNRLNIQHDTVGSGAAAAGKWVEVVAWPMETTVKMKQADGSVEEVTLPPGTVYMGVQWDDGPWQAVKQGKITGLSLGGRALRIREGEGLQDMGFKLAQYGYPMGHAYEDSNGDGLCDDCGMSQQMHEAPDDSGYGS